MTDVDNGMIHNFGIDSADTWIEIRQPNFKGSRALGVGGGLSFLDAF